jgi:lactate racemase
MKTLDAGEIARTVDEGIAGLGLRTGQRLVGVIPDDTRSFEPQVVHRLIAACRDRGVHCELLIATGTHAAMNEERIDRFLDRPAAPELFRDTPVHNHSMAPSGLVSLGAVDAGELSGGRIAGQVEITVNRRVFDYDHAVIVGPVFPHEVVGMSGGWKYFFPGIAGAEVINQSHWLGALIGIHEIIGRSETPVRRMVEAAGTMVASRRPVSCLSLVMHGHDLFGLFFGEPVKSHREAAALSREVNIVWTPRRYRRVIAECPVKYDELWTGGKLAYKTQEVVEEGGEIVMLAPHLDRIAPQHPDVEKIGYHSLAYFLGQWDRYRDIEPSSLAHSTHVAGPGTYTDGIEALAATRVLASRVSQERCAAINLVYRDPGTVPTAPDEDTLWVPQAGEQLFVCEDRRASLAAELR